MFKQIPGNTKDNTMKELVKSEFNLSDMLADKIKSIVDRSDSLIKRLKITFKNGYGISIVKGDRFIYCGKDTYEIAPLDKNKEINGDLLNINGDDVLGWQTKQDIIEHMTKLSNL